MTEVISMVTDKATDGVARKSKRPPRSEIARVLTDNATVTVKGTFGPKQARGYRFWAQTIGPAGRYSAGTSPSFAADKTGYLAYSQEADNALNELLRSLWAEGWQPTGFGREWY